MDFDQFAPGHSAADNDAAPMLRIITGGRLVLNAAARRLLGDTEFVQLFWDSDTASIGILPSAEGDPDTHRVSSAADQAVITSNEFVALYDIPQSHGLPITQDGRMLVAAVRR